MNMMNAQAGCLVLVDYQARLMPAIHAAADVTAAALTLARAARLLEVPVIGTEHDPGRLGPSPADLAALCAHVLPKTRFGACADGLTAALERYAAGRTQVVIAGCEAHVCVLQTALGLLDAGRQVFVVGNASGSRRPSDHAAAMRRLERAGATVVTHEMVLFEWLADCRHPRMRDVLALVKAVPA